MMLLPDGISAGDVSPLPVRERIQALDVLRGVAVAGILVANVLIFFGLFAMPPDRAAALPTVAADRVASFLERVFVDGKFYSLYSLLFGIGFGVQLARGGAAALPRFRRRLRILLGIGAIHAFHISHLRSEDYSASSCRRSAFRCSPLGTQPRLD
ncbi:MAG: hypothetical protein M3Z54_07845 [Gemmatimonadota bacterium]|nr:hypothetical protein [Gemmatimonadota bacterium]